MDEQVDIINEQNEVLGVISKIQAHKDGTLHRCIVSQMIDSQGKWTLVEQASTRQDPGQFVSPVGGHVQTGESSEDALKREALEEMGLSNFEFKQVGTFIFNREVIGRKENHYFILFEIYTDQVPTINHESVSFTKFSEKELKYALAQTPEKFGAAFHRIIDSIYPHLRYESDKMH